MAIGLGRLNLPQGRRVDRAFLTAATSTRYNRFVIERMIRVASSFREAERMDRADIAAMSLEERISVVERLTPA